MKENDTVKLLRECDAGIKIGIDSIEDALDKVSSKRLIETLNDSKRDHDKLKTECKQLLNSVGDSGKVPSPLAETMSRMKVTLKLLADGSDAAIADLMTDGCNMGIKSLARYLNQYALADEKSKDIAKRTINLEERLVRDIRAFL